MANSLYRELQELRENVKTFINIEDTLAFSAPEESGLYLIGNTNFNPFTKEELYFVKVGKSVNLYNRMKTYKTDNPALFHIDYLELPREILNDNEKMSHIILYENCEEKVQYTEEWVKVSRETYLEICEKKFDYFFEKSHWRG